MSDTVGLNGEPDDRAANNCFGCSPSNPVGLHLRFAVEHHESGTVTSTAVVALPSLYEGGAGNLHGGVIATLLDEAMSKLNKPLGASAMTRQMEVEYLRPVSVGRQLTVVGRHVRREGRKLFHAAELLGEDGGVLARATALFIVIE